MWLCGSCAGENPEGTKFCGHCGAAAGASGDAPAETTTGDSASDVAEALKSFVSRQVADKLIDTGGAPAQERRLVTAVFADISGFTPLAHALDAEALSEVIDPIIQSLTNTVGRYDGVVEKFMGDALLALFGAPTAHEDDAVRAITTALEMHDVVAKSKSLLPPGVPPLTLHVGVNSGHVIARLIGSDIRLDYAVLGDAINMAQRLESVAPSGETYVGETTYRLAEPHFDFEFAGNQTLKGKPEPVPAWRVVGRRHAPRVGDKRARAFVGRDKEVAAAGGILDNLERGRGGVITVLGDPGVGKSRLMRELRERDDNRSTWLHGRCISYGASMAYWPYAELIRHLTDIQTQDDNHTALAKLETGLSDLGIEGFPFIAGLLGLRTGDAESKDVEPEAFRRGVQDAITSAIRNLAARRPLVLVLEDVHWADMSTIELTAWLARLCAEHPFVLYVTGRPEATDVMARLEQHLGPAFRQRLDLAPLGDDSVLDLIRSLLGSDPPPELAGVIVDRAGGNPFFAEEILRSVQDAGLLERDGHEWRLQGGWRAEMVPPTVEGVLSGRIDRLSHGPATTLQAASVIGRRIPMLLLRQLMTEVSDLDDAVTKLVDAGLIDRVDDERYQLMFRHALVQEVAYNRLLRKHKRQLHLRVADTAEVLYGAGDDVVALLARHLYLAEAGTRAVPYLIRAGHQDRKLFANEEALVHFSHAREIAEKHPETATQRAVIDLHLGELHELLGRFEEAHTFFGEVLAVESSPKAWRGLASCLRHRGEYQAALDVLDQAFATGLEGSDTADLWLERGWSLSLTGRYAEGSDALLRGLDEVGGTGDTVAGQLLLQLGKNRVQEGEFETGLKNAVEAKTILEEAGDLEGVVRAMRVIGGIYRDLDRLDDSAEILRRAVPLAERVGRADELAGVLMNLGAAELDQGDYQAAAVATLQAIEEFERIDHGHGRAAAYANLGEILMHQNELENALSYCMKGRELATKIGYQYVVADADLTMAQVLIRMGRETQAIDVAERSATLFAEIDAGPVAAKALRIAAQASRASNDNERATELLLRARSLSPELSG